MREKQSTVCIDEPDAVKYHLGSHLVLESTRGIEYLSIPADIQSCIKPQSMQALAFQPVSNIAFNTVPSGKFPVEKWSFT